MTTSTASSDLPLRDPRELAAELPPVEQLLLALDFDGTLAPIVTRPEQARPVDAALKALHDLATRTSVAIISGRPLADLRQRVGPLPAIWAGGHGAQLLLPDGQHDQLIEPEAVAGLLDGAERDVRRLVDHEAGWLVERKSTSLAVHHRLASEDSVATHGPRLQAILERHAQVPPGGEVLEGKAVVELRARGVDKGAALLRIAARTPGLIPVAIGDDVTDEDAFRVALERGGHAVLVADAPRASVAQHRLRDPKAVAQLLRVLAGVED